MDEKDIKPLSTSQTFIFFQLVLTLIVLLIYGIYSLYAYGQRREVTEGCYSEIQGWVAEYPSLKPAIAEAMSDNQITGYEYDTLYEARNQAKIDAQVKAAEDRKNSLKQEVTVVKG